MRRMFRAGVCMLAIMSLCASTAIAKHSRSTKCAAPAEVSAIAATSIQQELMVAALTCNQIANFNAFQTNFGPELRTSDRTLMRMFLRLYGGRGEAEYHAFKTRLANNSEMRSIHGNQDFCTAAGLVFSAALAATKPSLSDFVSGVQVEDPSPVNSCQMQVTLSLSGAMATPSIMPRQKPTQFEDISLPVSPPAAYLPTVDAAGSPPPTNATTTIATPTSATATNATVTASSATATSATATASNSAASQPNAQAPAADQPKKKKGFLSGLFN
jgi:hypothetical protein